MSASIKEESPQLGPVVVLIKDPDRVKTHTVNTAHGLDGTLDIFGDEIESLHRIQRLHVDDLTTGEDICLYIVEEADISSAEARRHLLDRYPHEYHFDFGI